LFKAVHTFCSETTMHLRTLTSSVETVSNHFQLAV
jgi:hypothetical protein